MEPVKSRVASTTAPVVRVMDDKTFRQVVTPSAVLSRLDTIMRLLWRCVAKRKVSFEISEIEGDWVRVKALGDPRQRDRYVWMRVEDTFTLTWKTEVEHEVTFEEPND